MLRDLICRALITLVRRLETDIVFLKCWLLITGSLLNPELNFKPFFSHIRSCIIRPHHIPAVPYYANRALLCQAAGLFVVLSKSKRRASPRLSPCRLEHSTSILCLILLLLHVTDEQDSRGVEFVCGVHHTSL